ncbi:hypothetical protein SAMN04488025_104162 [Planifilum fulgidum]|uniref:Uncharacterized protein n=1 Tax=Planifilum fulgidum TaxID=201973 RepID=A0A1I2LE15_9BACL|nr:hypothetical protein [Planifilum fulgidum]SFF75717.1 hypothetical protein SAMN04488025_104162 [Planifilum fulgidum]
MKGRIRPLMAEMAFVLVSVALLKEWLFPLFIGYWFTDAELAAAQLERTAILTGTVTAIIYAGLGSSAKYGHGLSYTRSLGAFAAVHAPVLLSWIPALDSLSLLRFIRLTWEGLLGDALGLFRLVNPDALPVATLLLALLLYTAGRGLRIEDQKRREEPDRRRVRIPYRHRG